MWVQHSFNFCQASSHSNLKVAPIKSPMLHG